MTESGSAAAAVVAFCATWSRLDIDEIMGFFADDAVYHNMPLEPTVGAPAIREFIAGFTTGVERVDFEVLHLVAEGDRVLTERVDTFVMPEKTIALPVMGIFELRDGKIASWRDYFDLQSYMSQLAG